jgi:hypothetical protein
MSEAKYYVPEIEEFCLGFEYEISGFIQSGITYFVGNVGEWTKFKLTKENYDNPDAYGATMLGSLGQLISLGRVRVKRLDREDVESFGLVYAGWKRVSHDYYGKMENKDVAVHVFNDNTVTVSVRVDGMIESECTNVIIKNKSELKRILKQVGV